jgi:Aspartyl/Asparaginyl beta-hydroxylase
MAATRLFFQAGYLRVPSLRFFKRASKRIVLPALAIFFIPKTFAVYLCIGLVDFARNKQRTWDMLDRYFAGNGFQTWFLSPFNLLMDILTWPYWNKKIYELSDLPQGHQDEITSIIDAAHSNGLVGKLKEQMDGKRRGMIFFKWYGKNIETSVNVPEFHRDYRYVRSIGVSIFNKKQSTGKHFGPLRVTLRVLYNINDINSEKAYIKVGNHIHYWRDHKLFIFDDTLQHQSCNESDDLRFCMFVDILRPSLFPRLMSGILTCVRTAVGGRFSPRLAFKHWVMIK